MIVTRSRAASRSSTPVLESENEEHSVMPCKKAKMETTDLRSSFDICMADITTHEWPEQKPNRRKNVRKHRETVVATCEEEKKDLRDLILSDSISQNVMEGILRLAGVVVREEFSIAEDVLNVLKNDANAVRELVALNILPYLPADMEKIGLLPPAPGSEEIVKDMLGQSSAKEDDQEEKDPIIVPFTPEKFFEEMEDNEPIADQILREMMARKTRMGQRRVSKRSKRSKIATSLYLNQKYGGDQEFHSTPFSRRRFRSGSTPKKEAILKKCPFKHRLLIRVDGSNPLTTPKAGGKGRRGTGRS